MARVNDFRLSHYFRLYEFESPDTKEVKLHPTLFYKIFWLRHILKKPVIITSGYRTKSYNRALKRRGYNAHPQSYHLLGRAADILVRGFKWQEAVRIARELKFRKVIYYPKRGHIHLSV